MAEKLRYAIYTCTERDADFRLVETDVVGWGATAPSIQQAWPNMSNEDV